jgi:hypothetical protein
MKFGLFLIVPALLLAQAPPRPDQPAAVAAASPGGSGADPLIERVRLAVYHFVTSLPDFVCDERVRRFDSHTINPDWQFKDRLDVELMFLHGKEDYRNVRLDGKPIKKGTPGDTGQWSTGEFGSMLAGVFDPATQTAFHFARESTVAGRPLRVYDYSVTQARSNWAIRLAYSIWPAYRGSVWIDPQSGQVMRVDFRTKTLPPDYPVDKIEQDVDYAWVTISGAQHLLPVRSTTVSCKIRTAKCDKNDVEFTNYRHFAVASQILATGDNTSAPENGAAMPK